ncbi:G-box-binding factor-like [Calliphora vicina]|uniref:G-box-binding factor-like n=1 Tax=Calliphora vicina TaxID=7373 RepID=UPI00325AC967
MTPERRLDIVERLGYCTNCLARSHNIRSCTSMESCIKCNQLHHTMLHPSRTRSPSPNMSTVSSQRGRDTEIQIQPHQQPLQHHHHHRQHHHQQHHHQHRQHRHHQPRQPHYRRHLRQQPHHRRHQRQHPHQQQRHQIQRQQNQQRQRQQSPAPIASSTTPPMPDQHILAEAIKSLANVLCYQNKPE